jgi:hypothetical protein
MVGAWPEHVMLLRKGNDPQAARLPQDCVEGLPAPRCTPDGLRTGRPL